MADHQTAPCGQFYANLCSSDSDTLLSLVDLPPSSPPPPMPPDASLTELAVSAVYAKGGVVGYESDTTAGASVGVCTDVSLTECAANSTDVAWIMFDVGAQHSNLYSMRVHLMPPATTIGRRLSAVDCGVNTMTNHKYHSGTLLVGPLVLTAVDSDPCRHMCVNDHRCNHWNFEQTSDTQGACTTFNSVDERIAATSSFTSADCTPTRAYDAPDYDTLDHLEVWVSRSIASFGTRAATIRSSQYNEGQTTVYLTEGEDSANGRYLYLRSFESNTQLRIDGVQIFAAPEEGRRLDEEARRLEERSKKQGPSGKPTKQSKLPSFSWPNVWRMRNLTMVTCMNETDAPKLANDARQKAAMLWAELTEEESLIGCISCLTHKPTNCTQWFYATHGVRFAHTSKKEKEHRRMMEQLERDAPERKRNLEEAFGKSCCRTHKLTGAKECGKQFCAKAVKHRANKRIAHTLRRLHDRPGQTTLSVQQLVATDLVAPHLHHNPLCNSGDQENAMECVSSSLIKHLGDKYGFSESEIDEKLSRYGVTIADMLTSHLKHSAKSTDRKKQQYKSDPKGNEKAMAARMAERARRSLSSEEKRPKRVKGPRASWIKRSSPAARRLSEAETLEPPSTVRIEVEPLGLSGRQVRERKKQHEQFVRNNSLAAKGLLKAANLASATTGGRPATMSNLMSAAWESSLATDGSLIGRTRSVFEGLGRVGTRISEISSMVAKAHEEQPTETPVSPVLNRRRKLTEFEEAQYNRVDELTKHVNAGFKVPTHVDEEWGWVVDSVDWKYWWDETHRVGNILYNRHKWVHQHAEDFGSLPVGELPHEHRTGYSLMDINAPPTHLGTWIRSKVNGNNQHTPHRQLHEKRVLTTLPRAPSPEQKRKRSLIGSFLDASVNQEDPFQAAWDALHYNDHQTHTRRVLEGAAWVSTSFVDTTSSAATAAADFLFGDPSFSPPERVPFSEMGQQAFKYASYDTLLCYMYPPDVRRGGPTGYGDAIKLHYSNRACFPFIPFIPADMESFRSTFSLNEDFKFSDLEYNNSCDSAAVKALIGPMMGGLSTVGFIAAPYGTLLRMAEGIDSLRNLGSTGDTKLTSIQKATAVVCGVAQLGGLIWMAVCITVIGILCICGPIGSWACLRCYRKCRGASRRIRLREQAIDDLLIQSGYETDKPTVDMRMRGSGHVRLPLDGE